MHFLLGVLAAAVALPLAIANFYIYSVREFLIPSPGEAAAMTPGYRFFNSHPDCKDVGNSIFYAGSGDFSGEKTGVRCDNCKEGDTDPMLVEVNLKNHGHWTMYEDRGWQMYGTDNDNLIGTCREERVDDYICAIPPMPTEVDGQSFLLCETVLTADGL